MRLRRENNLGLTPMLDVTIFNVEHGQSIFFYSQAQPAYGMFVDCGNTQAFEPIDSVLPLLPRDQLGRPVLGNLTLTNYDHDHFSGLPYLMGKTLISTIRFAKNLSTSEIIALKPVRTEALDRVCHLQNTYIYPAPLHIPPYVVATFNLSKNSFPAGASNTNNLSQVVFVGYSGSVICICGDLEAAGWNQLLLQENFRLWLRATNVFVAAHHGRESGHAKEAFEHCSPECIIFSDKNIEHGTQEGMAQAYANHVTGNGILVVNQSSLTPRKILTTRSDGHIAIRFTQTATREYRTFPS